MIKIYNIFINIALFYLISISVYAQQGFGGVAKNLMDPVTIFYQFIQSGCILIGGGFLFASIVKYFEHRRNPLMVPISTVVFLLIAGIILVALPLIAYVSQTGVHYQFSR